MKKIVLLFIGLAVGCQQPAAKKNEAYDDSKSPKNTLNYVGTYKGILPCADCHGLETEITINENSTFSIKTKYQGKGDKVYMQKGNFSWNKKGNTIILTDVKNAPNQYFVGKNTLTQLNIYGKKITGNLAEEYILSKKPTDTSNSEAEAVNKGTTVDLNSRMATTTVIQKVNPAVGKYTLAETKWKLILLNKKKVAKKGKKSYFLELDSKSGRFSAFAGCNSIGGSYAMPATDKLAFTDVFSTKMSCADMKLEDSFTAILPQVFFYKLDKETLTLLSEDKKILVKFEAIK